MVFCLESQRLRVKAEASRNRNAQEAAQEAVKCARSDAPVAVCGTALQRFWDIEPPPRPTGPRGQ
jgi:hypothetical protein